jgi:polyhydroxyalkanoate synthesis repressor PhaR
MANNDGSQQESPVTIKKYANRRLYNTASSSYVTLDQLCQMVQEGVDFVVYDAKTGEDITRSVLTQIIVEEESKGQSLLPVTFLRQIISFYGDSLQQVLPQYLDMSMRAFARNQEQVRKYLEGVKETFGGLFPFAPFEEMGKRNMAMFEQAMKMFAPVPPTEEKEEREAPAKEPEGAEEESNPDAQLKELENKVAELQRQFAALAKKTSR